MFNRKKAAPTPPMGWNSWDCYGAGVDEAALMKNAEFVKEKLLPYGWKYIVCDIQWYEPKAVDTRYNDFAPLCTDEYSRLIPAENRFPSAAGGKGFSVIAEKIHEMGLKFGIHIMRGIPRQAVHNGTPIKGTDATARDIAASFSLCSWNTDMYGVDPRKKGAQEYYNSLFEMYAEWGVDFVKVDDICNTEYNRADPYSAKREIEMIRKAIDSCGREMVLSLSPGPATIENAWHLRANADMWRLTGDFWDDWQKLRDMFRRCEIWFAHVGDGCWPDCDMLPLGKLCVSDRYLNDGRPCRFTKDEQLTLMNLWCLFRSPLMLGAETSDMDKFTLSLLTNGELLAVNQQAIKSFPIRSSESEAVWQAQMPDGTNAVGLFNLTDSPSEISVSVRELGLDDVKAFRDLWSKESVYPEDGVLRVALEPHASKVFRTQKQTEA